jgi:AcrR family transcriptional regulator
MLSLTTSWPKVIFNGPRAEWVQKESLMAYHHGRLRAALLERAAEVIAEGGVAALSLRGLARDLGVSHAAPSRHFADRAALLAALATEAFERSVALMRVRSQAAGADPVARYRALGRAYVEFARREPAWFRAMNHPEVQTFADEPLGKARRAWLVTLRDGAAAAQASGWHPEADLESLVAFSIAAAMGAATLFSEPRLSQHLESDDLDALADEVLRLVVAGSSGDAPRLAVAGSADDAPRLAVAGSADDAPRLAGK